MKKIIAIASALLMTLGAWAQNASEQRMQQDLEVAENILSTLLKQQYGKRNFFPMNVEATYLSGYGATFHVPMDGPFNFFVEFQEPVTVNITGDGQNSTYAYTYRNSKRAAEKEMKRAQEEMERANEEMQRANEELERANQEMKRATEERERAEKDRVRSTSRSRSSGGGVYVTSPDMEDDEDEGDSARIIANERFLRAAKDFLADYGDVLSQLKPEEHVMVTNKGQGAGDDFFRRSRQILSVEAVRSDITSFKQGKMTRDQFLAKLKVVNTETAETLDPDLEVFSSMLTRLYREDLSRTYFSNRVSYERMKNYGVIYYMSVFSSNEMGDDKFEMPTLQLRNMDQAARDAKVKELYPKFEQEMKENLVDYGRTLRSIGPDEQLMLNIKMTKCVGCKLPASMEVAVKGSVLKDYSAGKITREAAVAKITVKKVGEQ